MKKALALAAVLSVVIGGCIFLTSCSATEGERPFRELEEADIASATVQLTPPDKTIRITDIEELVGYLRDAVIYEEDSSYTECSGQAVIFSLVMTDGTRTAVMAYNPFLVIDGTGYRTEYGPCEALNAYANRLLNSEEAVIQVKPPALYVESAGVSVEALLGTYSWHYPNPDGTATGINADSPHPLDCRDMLNPIQAPGATVTLRFAEEPFAVKSIRCWSDAHWNDSSAADEELTAKGYELELKPGGWIYEVLAEWNEAEYGGTASYVFYAIAPPEKE